MNKTLATGLLAAGMALTTSPSEAQEVRIKDSTNKNLIETMAQERSSSAEKTISFEQAQKELKMKEDIKQLLEQEFSKNPELQHLEKKYGNELILDQLTSLAKTISENPDQFGSFNAKGEYHPDKKAITRLVQSVYEDNLLGTVELITSMISILYNVNDFNTSTYYVRFGFLNILPKKFTL